MDIVPDFAGEDKRTECLSWLNHKNILGWLKTVGGFSNAKGGRFFIGVEPKNYDLIGMDSQELDSEKLFFYKTIKEHVSIPLKISTKTISYAIRGKPRYILEIDVPVSQQKPVVILFQGMPMIFMRRDGHTNPATIEEIRNLSLSSTPSFDTQPTDIPFSESDFSSLYRFYSERNTGEKPTVKGLASLGFFDEKGFLRKGAYLFSDACQEEKTKIVCSIYPSANRGKDVVLASNSFTGNLIDGLRFMWDFLQKSMNHGFVKKETFHEDLDAFPKRALFEALVNALVHRDYFQSGTQISIDMFQDRLVITSPGSAFENAEIPPTYDLTTFISKRRNRLISDVFVYCHAMEARGTGFEKIAEDYKDADLSHKPFLYSKDSHFTIVLPDRTYLSGVPLFKDALLYTMPSDKSSRFDSDILTFCYGKERSVKEITEHLGISNSSFFRDKILKNLVDQGLLVEKQGKRSKNYWTNSMKVHLR